jgi:GNAT superfamily N-acetyltransferase
MEWRCPFEDSEVDALHAECFGHAPLGHGWWTQVNRYSLGWLCSRLSGQLVGFANVAWDGGAHAFLLDVMVAEPLRRRGVATRIVEAAATRARDAGCGWLHVDFEPQLRPLYLGTCGFAPTDAGLLKLR